MTITAYTEGVCGDGAAILRDGVPMSVSEILDALNAAAAREAVPVYQMRILDGSQEQNIWAEVTHDEFNTPLKNPDEWEKRVLYTAPLAPAVPGNSPEIPDSWISCSERMPVIGELEWRTALPVLVKCEMGVIPAYYGFTYHEGEQCFGFMESVKFGDATGSGPEQHENRLMMHVTHWMPLPAAPEVGQ